MGVGAAAVCFVILLYLPEESVAEVQAPWWAMLLLFVAVPAGLLSSFALTDHCPWGKEGLAGWLRPRAIAVLFAALFFVFSTATDVLSHLAPRQARETRPLAIEDTVTRTERKIDALTAQSDADAASGSLARQKIAGLWGESGCAVAYRFSMIDDALIVDAVRRPAGAEPYHMVATITAATSDSLEVVGESPSEARGKAARFTYSTNGVTERLRWHDKVNSVPLDLDRCA